MFPGVEQRTSFIITFCEYIPDFSEQFPIFLVPTKGNFWWKTKTKQEVSISAWFLSIFCSLFHWKLYYGQQEDNTARGLLFSKSKCLHDKRWLDLKVGLLENRRPLKYLSKGRGKTNRRCRATRGLFIAYSVSPPCIFTLTFTFTFIFTIASHPQGRMGWEGTRWAAVNYLMLTWLPIVQLFFAQMRLKKDCCCNHVLCKSLCALYIQTGMLLQSCQTHLLQLYASWQSKSSTNYAVLIAN